MNERSKYVNKNCILGQKIRAMGVTERKWELCKLAASVNLGRLHGGTGLSRASLNNS